MRFHVGLLVGALHFGDRLAVLRAHLEHLFRGGERILVACVLLGCLEALGRAVEVFKLGCGQYESTAYRVVGLFVPERTGSIERFQHQRVGMSRQRWSVVEFRGLLPG
jgi:hypothetical protein